MTGLPYSRGLVSVKAFFGNYGPRGVVVDPPTVMNLERRNRRRAKSLRVLVSLDTAFAVMLVSSCGLPDGEVRATCSGHPASEIRTSFNGIEVSGADVGVLNVNRLEVGDIIPEDRFKYARGVATSLKYELSVHPAEEAPADVQSWLGTVRGLQFDISVDDRTLSMALSEHLDLRGTVADATRVFIDYGKWEGMRNVAEIVNLDGSARHYPNLANEGRRFLLVSSAIYATSIWPAFLDRAWTADIFKIDGSYVHVNYDCTYIDELNKWADVEKRAVPMIVFYTPLVYDRGAQRFRVADGMTHARLSDR